MFDRSALLLISAAAPALAGCGGAASVKPVASAAVSKPAASLAASKPAGSIAASKPAASGAAAAQAAPSGVTLTIVQPANGATVPAGTATVTYDVTGITLVPAAQAQKLTDYHAHVLLDEDATPYLSQFQPAPMGDPKLIHTAAQTVTFDNVASGSHTITVWITTSNHVSVNPPISAKSTFTAQ
jgi:hypothetical protein